MLTNLLAYINTYGYKAIFLLIAIENLFPPIPCEIILTFGGFMTTITNLTPLGVITVASLGSYLGAVILYWFGYLINLERLEKLLVRFYFKRHDLSRSLSCQRTDTIYLYFYFSISFISLTINSFNFFLSGRCSIYVDTNN